MIFKRKKISVLLIFVMVLSLFAKCNIAFAAESTNQNQKYLRVNSKVLKFNEVIYVDGTDGDDTNGDGSSNTPFKTIVKGFNYLNENCREGGAIVIKDGTYDLNGIFTGYSHNINNKYNGMKISLLAETMGKVSFENIGEWMIVENSNSSRIKVNLYGIVFKSIQQNFYQLGGDDWVNEYYNCAFISGFGGWNRIVQNASIKVENSLFIGNLNSYGVPNAVSGSAINCASTSEYIDPVNGTITSSLYNVTIDSDYNITSDGWKNAGIGTNPDGTVANIGVYGGQFAWGSKVAEESSAMKLKVVLEVNEQLQLSVDDDLGENLQMIWTSSDRDVASVDVNGIVTALKPGNSIISVISNDGTYADFINVLVVDDADDYRLAVDLKVGKSCRLTVDDLTDTFTVNWMSLDPSVATVSNRGKVTAVGKGLTVIIAQDETGNEIGQIYIRVRE